MDLWECYGKSLMRKIGIAKKLMILNVVHSFRNGSLVRDIFKRVEANNDWTNFSELLESTPRGNYGNMALHFLSKEIIPSVKGSIRWNKNNSNDTPDSAKGVIK